MVRRTTARVLGRLGFSVVTATATEALGMLASGDTFDAVVSDYDMPDASGADVLDAAQAAGVEVFVFHTGNPDAKRHGLPVALKPYPPRELAALLRGT